MTTSAGSLELVSGPNTDTAVSQLMFKQITIWETYGMLTMRRLLWWEGCSASTALMAV